MNMLLLFEKDFINEGRDVRITDHRLTHIQKVLKKTKGDSLCVGCEGGKIGSGIITKITGEYVLLEANFSINPPPSLPLTLLIALPRPKVFRRIIQTITAMGVKNIFIINSYRVEKSYWESPKLCKEKIESYIIEGLEQAKDTVMPEITFKKYFKPFVEDELPLICSKTTNIVAHPYSSIRCPGGLNGPVTLAIGPEGGFIPYEIEKLQKTGFEPVHLGQRILKVETAVPVLLSHICSVT